MFYNKMYKTTLMILLAALVLAGCSAQAEPVTKSTLQFGTIIQITIFDDADLPALEKALAHMRNLEEVLSTSIEDSNVNVFNTASHNEPIKLEPHAVNVIKKGLYYSAFSDGRFDITIQPVVDLWGIGSEAAAVPDPDALHAALKMVDYTQLTFDEAEKTLKKTRDGVKIDLGGIAKGYAADEAIRILKENGVTKALVNLGGNVYALGEKEKNTPWNVGIQDPESAQGDMVGIVPVADMAVITSGTYERYFEEDGIRYHHILSTEDGYPVNNQILGISIITDSAIDGDALSTVIYTEGLEEGLKTVETLENVEAIFVTKGKKIYLSSGMQDAFQLTNESYTIAKP
jgi:thiamine biosynthesis lipoprotein